MERKYKICVYAICKNEEKFIDNWMQSVSEADLVVVTDTGSSDNSVGKLRERGAQVHMLKIDPFRFDVSRNYCMGFIPDDIDICISLDLDEIIQPGWREAIEKAWQPDSKLGRYLFNWKIGADGVAQVQYYYDRIHARHGFEWIYPTHEILHYTGDGVMKETFIPGLTVNHYPDTKKNRSFNLPLLKLAVEECKSARNMHYLGREYMYAQEWENCIQTLKEQLMQSDSVWNEERSASMRFIARSYGMLGNNDERKHWLYKAIAQAPHLREPYVEFAQLGYECENWECTHFFALEALAIKNKSFGYANEIFAWNYEPYDLAAISAYKLGNKKEAERYSLMALQLDPQNERLKNNHLFYV